MQSDERVGLICLTKRSGLTVCCYLLIILSFLPEHINGQILRDSESLTLVKKCIFYTYNMEAGKARSLLSEIDRAFPDHPIPLLLRGMITYWENYPLRADSPARRDYEQYMQKSIELCEENKNIEDDPEYLLANLCARGMLLLFYSENDLSKEVIPLAAATYRYIRLSFHYTSVYNDFLFFTGLYNYYREKYPEVYPVYKPLALLFPGGDSSRGIDELRTSASSSIFMRAESSMFLAGIFMSFEDNLKEASLYIRKLFEKYPGNLQYRALYIKNLLLEKKFAEAEKLILSSSAKTDNSYFRVQLLIFDAILQEKIYQNFDLAREYYSRGLNDISIYGRYGNEFAAYCWFGLSRISDEKNDEKARKSARNKARELADFKKINFD